MRGPIERKQEVLVVTENDYFEVLVLGEDGKYRAMRINALNLLSGGEGSLPIVTSVAGRTGAVTIASTDITDSTDVGRNLGTLTNPDALSFLQINADNSVSALSADNFRDAISAKEAVFEMTAAATIHGRRVVVSESGEIRHPDLDTPDDAKKIIGISTQAGSIGGSILVRSSGIMSDGTWSWSDGMVWCGADGVLTQSPASDKWLQPVARVLNATTIDVMLPQPILR